MVVEDETGRWGNINIRLRIAPDPGEHFLAYSEQPDFVRINRSLPQLSILKDNTWNAQSPGSQKHTSVSITWQPHLILTYFCREKVGTNKEEIRLQGTKWVISRPINSNQFCWAVSHERLQTTKINSSRKPSWAKSISVSGELERARGSGVSGGRGGRDSDSWTELGKSSALWRAEVDRNRERSQVDSPEPTQDGSDGGLRGRPQKT